MSLLKEISVKELQLDLKNFRTMPQASEKEAIQAMIAVGGTRFWGIMESLLELGYLKTENIIVQEIKGKHVVKEGNRRIAALKLILGILKTEQYNIPKKYVSQIESLTSLWKSENSKVSCLVYSDSKADTKILDRIVSLTHGKKESAGRDPWKAVAKARHDRDVSNISEPALDVLEHFLKKTRLISPIQKEIWSADYPLTVLHELMRLLSPVLGLSKISDFATAYPNTPIPKKFEELIKEIGEEVFGFEYIRTEFDKILKFLDIDISDEDKENGAKPKNNASNKAASTAAKKSATPRKAAAALSNTDPKHINRKMKNFILRGDNLEKIVALRDELILLNIEKTPYSFCFLLRTIFELSARRYCKSNNISLINIDPKKGTRKEKTLREMLSAVSKDIIDKGSDSIEKTKRKQDLQGATQELTSSNGILSVTSMNLLVHNETFSTTGSSIASIFTKVFPLYEAMNQD